MVPTAIGIPIVIAPENFWERYGLLKAIRAINPK
jgi:hypothetical protein